MKIFFGIFAGLIWGALAAFIGALLSKKCLETGSVKAVSSAKLAKTAVNLAALAAVFLLRGVLPFRYELSLISAAISISILSTILAFRMSN